MEKYEDKANTLMRCIKQIISPAGSVVTIEAKSFNEIYSVVNHMLLSGYVSAMLEMSMEQFQSYPDAFNCADLYDCHSQQEGSDECTMEHELACMACIIHGGQSHD